MYNAPARPPIFIQGCERSGTTLLRYIVDSHPEVCCPSELYLGNTLESLKVTLERSTAMFLPEGDRDRFVTSELRRITSDILCRYADRKKKRLWCEKTPLNLRCLELIDRVFPDARHLCLFRNCMDVVHSCIEAGRYGFVTGLSEYVQRHPNNVVAAMVESWIEKTERLLAFQRRRPDRCFPLQYESLVFDPEQVMGKAYGFLGLPFDPSLLDSVFTTAHDLNEGDSGDRKIRLTRKIEHRSVGKGSTISRKLIPLPLLDRMNAVLRELDYPEVGLDWDVRPSPYRDRAPAPRAAAGAFGR